MIVTSKRYPIAKTSNTNAKPPIDTPTITYSDVDCDPVDCEVELCTVADTVMLGGRPASTRFRLRFVASTLLLNDAAVEAESEDIRVFTCMEAESARRSAICFVDMMETLAGETPAADATALIKADRSMAVKLANEIGRPTRMLTAYCLQALEEFEPVSENVPPGHGELPVAPPEQ